MGERGLSRVGRLVGAVVAICALAATMSACTAPAGEAEEHLSGTVTVRIWDENLAEAYRSSLESFEALHPDLDVRLDVVPWPDYFQALRTDVSSASGPDIFWLNAANYQDYVDNGFLIPIDDGIRSPDSATWSGALVAQYTKNGRLWGVPQVTDGGSALFYNRDLLNAAGISPDALAQLAWHPTDASRDTLLPALTRLTVDEQGRHPDDPAFDPEHVRAYGINAADELQNVVLNFVGSNGGRWQADDGSMTLTDPKTVEAYQYLADLINVHRVAPPAARTNADDGYTRDQFLQGRLALFESGTYNLANVYAGAGFEWGVVEIPKGPAGRVTSSPGVIAAGNSASANPDATRELLEWLGSADGNRCIAASGSAVPAVGTAREMYDQYWTERGVDVAPFFSPLDQATPIQTPTGQNFEAAQRAMAPALAQLFAGEAPAADALAEAQRLADAVTK